MKTPMQELIEQLKEMRDDYRTIVTIDAGLPIHSAVMLAESMLQKEKEVIKRAFNDGIELCGYESGLGDDDDEYYNETFNTEEK